MTTDHAGGEAPECPTLYRCVPTLIFLFITPKGLLLN